MVIIGYRIHTTDMQQLDMELMKAQRKINTIAQREYGNLLGEEIAFLCDNVSLNILQRNPATSLYDDAVQNLSRKMQIAGTVGSATKYNYQIYAHLMAEGEYTYLDVLCNNPIFLPAFKNMEPFGLTEDECADEKNAKTILWKRLHKAYKDRQPLSVNLSPSVTPDKERIRYPSTRDRCQDMARHHLINVYLNQISGGEQIPPFLLMKDMDLAMEMLLQSEGKHALALKKAELAGILIDLEKDDSIVYDIMQEHKETPVEERGLNG